MSWLKFVLGYCVLVAVGLWFLHRSREVLPPHEPGTTAGYDPGRKAKADEADPGPHAHLR
jgi:hypothetical protein